MCVCVCVCVEVLEGLIRLRISRDVLFRISHRHDTSLESFVIVIRINHNINIPVIKKYQNNGLANFRSTESAFILFKVRPH